MEMHEESADAYAKVRSLVKETVAGAEAKIGTFYEHMARKARAPTRAEWKSFRINQPYGFVQLKDGRWLPYNRIYKPLGVSSRAWVDYEAFAYMAVQFPTDPREVSGVWVCQSETHLWLYSDDSASLQTYYQRFARLASAMCPWRLTPGVLV
jgi:hypothetical protein